MGMVYIPTVGFCVNKKRRFSKNRLQLKIRLVRKETFLGHGLRALPLEIPNYLQKGLVYTLAVGFCVNKKRRFSPIGLQRKFRLLRKELRRTIFNRRLSCCEKSL